MNNYHHYIALIIIATFTPSIICMQNVQKQNCMRITTGQKILITNLEIGKKVQWTSNDKDPLDNNKKDITKNSKTTTIVQCAEFSVPLSENAWKKWEKKKTRTIQLNLKGILALSCKNVGRLPASQTTYNYCVEVKNKELAIKLSIKNAIQMPKNIAMINKDLTTQKSSLCSESPIGIDLHISDSLFFDNKK